MSKYMQRFDREQRHSSVPIGNGSGPRLRRQQSNTGMPPFERSVRTSRERRSQHRYRRIPAAKPPPRLILRQRVFAIPTNAQIRVLSDEIVRTRQKNEIEKRARGSARD